MDLTGREIVLGVTGGIAAYKSAEVVSRLRHLGANVHVIMTKNATEFVSPLTFQTLSANQVVTDTFQAPEYWNVEHVALAKRAEIFVIAPATANIMAKMACGIADDMLSTTVLATKAPVLLAPAMNTGMWTAAATQANLKTLQERGIQFVGPDCGILACGDEGAGRMSEPEAIVAAICDRLNARSDLAGMKVLVTAGATRERLDPVRYMTNDSSGKMGFAIVEAARARGAEVTTVYGNVTAQVPAGIRRIQIESAQELYDVMMREAPEQDIIIQAAAVCDYRFEKTAKSKIKKDEGEALTLTLTENPDVAKAVGAIKKKGQTLVGFAAETDNVKKNAVDKLKKKNLDMIVANDVTKPGAGFNVDTNIAALITKDGVEEEPLMTKRELADKILDKIVELRK
ncbi:bifunctional phosphopantothenoylcysteine decarboxylase/phosphopantothenate--cysteine ligase CoaBC [Aristaeella hokkaidonensis]|uniref:Bifunctional phosphopantothenoylcysteine decarboxylase/phosphopantothenate--cysteine ligase CoaBC n=1 Tax=Aristaeella hokkaidonensis TaxID=3046382 RepID=A0AC61N4M4_9FIRM|nr:bifunctional phosphopantothenoylcysteine decarboxylase/phosphopantothenate--cysteine ligase CoaBC [Aristaeella hokkaidonensis]QUC68115.1 bifunctional phosphopantothenoylcysteine decarboxylase/phosphopantothenate--cysteine ligase CoaBC [Aristaeella hokkaidonensis]SNT93189.1 phosphopantothenoylcysteine decarboxylase / phosphopantothenate--cysteine ligase [Aristaeella hokkaidonensis]